MKASTGCPSPNDHLHHHFCLVGWESCSWARQDHDLKRTLFVEPVGNGVGLGDHRQQFHNLFPELVGDAGTRVESSDAPKPFASASSPCANSQVMASSGVPSTPCLFFGLTKTNKWFVPISTRSLWLRVWAPSGALPLTSTGPVHARVTVEVPSDSNTA